MTAGAQYVMSMEKYANDMPAHTKGWNLSNCAKIAAEPWLQDCIGAKFDLGKYFFDIDQASARDEGGGRMYYEMSLAQRGEYAWWWKLLKSLSENDRLRLVSNSSSTQNWVTALALSWKNCNLMSRE